MSTYTDGAPPSVSSGPQDGPGPPDEVEEDTEADPAPDSGPPDSGSSWLQEEMRRRMAANQSSGGGRHARREGVDRPGVEHYLDRDPASPPVAPAPPARPPRTSWVPDPYSPSGLRPPPAAELFSEPPGRAGLPAPPDAAHPALRTQSAPPDAAHAAPPGTQSAPPETPRPAPRSRRPSPNPPELRASAPATPASPLPAVAPPPTAVEVTTPQVAASPAGSAFTPRPAPLSSGPGPAPATADPPAADSPPADPENADPGTPDVATPESDAGAKRVRVVLSERKGVARSVRTVVDVQELTPVGDLLRTNLIGTQLGVALRVAAVAGLTLGLLPALFALVPAIGQIEVLGLRLPWLLLGVLVYPFLLGLGWWHTRSAEKVEQNFADHVQD
ncbi:hypothetical protein [Pseudonocardia sp. H11422]|uniref:hypothetical protein n=1 Tax=Pseudonocardia sp. H11422 TaxID=2835866 RepID=UPI001BDBB765|nr:hypothetical protein [Pseudonocardia sp. H11422]